MKEEIENKIKEYQGYIKRLSSVSNAQPDEKRKVVKEVVGDAEIFITKQIVWLRNLANLIEK